MTKIHQVTHRPRHRLATRLLACLGLLGASSSACMTSQPPSIPLRLEDPFVFEGYASRPNALIVLQVYDRNARRWTSAGASTTSGNGAPIKFGGYDLYPWKIRWVFNDAFSTDYRECLWNANCNSPYGGVTRFRTYEVGSSPSVHYTFRPGGLDCTIDKVVQESLDLPTAYTQCHPDGARNEISISYSAPFP